MKTAVDSETKTPQKPQKAWKGKKIQAEEAEEALKKEFQDVEGMMSIRHLWTDCDVHRFRANWWIGNAIITSKFVYVFTGDDGKTVVTSEDGGWRKG